MNNEEIKKKAILVANEILYKKSFVSPVDLLIGMDVIKQKDYEDWRFKRIPYLESVCNKNLSKLSLIMKELRKFGKEKNLKPSFTAYFSWGKGKKVKLRFSKYGATNVEQGYSTHYVDVGRLHKTEQKVELSEEVEKDI